MLRCVALAAASLVLPGSAAAAGFALFEQGALGMGFAGAFTAQASDPSAIFHNAAGIAFLKRNQLYLGGTLIRSSVDFAGADPFPGEGASASQSAAILPVPAAYYTHQFSERTVLGVGLSVPYRLRSEWNDADRFSGRFISQLAELKVFSLNPTVAYQLADRLAVGAGIDIRLATLALERRVPLIDPFTQRVVDVGQARLESNTATGFGFNLGLLARPSDELSLGLAYRHKVNVDFEGSGSFTAIPTGNAQLDSRVASRLPAGSVPFSTSLELPAILSAGVAYRWADWTAEADVHWHQWSSFDRLVLRLEQRPDLSQVIAQEYQNTFQYRIGLERRIDEVWTVRGGYFYDESPAPAESLSPLLADASRHGIALGGAWRSGALRLDGSLSGEFLRDRSTGGGSRERFDGTYSSFVLKLGLFLGYGF